MATPNNNDDEECSLFRDFKELNMDGGNYLVWATTTKTELRGKKLLATLKDRPTKENHAERAQTAYNSAKFGRRNVDCLLRNQ